MSIEKNRQIARILMDDLFCETAYQFYGADYQFGHMIDYENAPIRGTLSADEAATDKRRGMSFFDQNKMTGEALKIIYPDGNTRALKSITVNEQRAVCEYLTHGGRNIFRRDVEHNFHSVKIFDFRDGKVVAVREYTDTAYLMSFGSAIAEFTKEFLNDKTREKQAQSFAWGASWLLASTAMDLGQPSPFAATGDAARNEAAVLALISAWNTEDMRDMLTETVMVSNEVDLVNTPDLGRSFHGLADVAALYDREADMFPGGLARRVVTMTAEENRVAVEIELSGTARLNPDKPFTTRMLQLFCLRAGKIFRLRQYLDSAYWMNHTPGLVPYIYGAR